MSWGLQRWLLRAKERDINHPLSWFAKDVPDTFDSAEQYYETLLGNVSEELRAQVHSALCENRASFRLVIADCHDKKRDVFAECHVSHPARPSDVLFLCQALPYCDFDEHGRPKVRFRGRALFGIVDQVHSDTQLVLKLGAEQRGALDRWHWTALRVTNLAPLRRVADALQQGMQHPCGLRHFRDDLYIGRDPDADLPGGRALERPLVSAGHVLHHCQGLVDALLARLNIPQLNAAVTILYKCTGVSVLQGPPGTGKTTTVLGLLSLLLQQSALSCPAFDGVLSSGTRGTIRKHRLMLTAPSNVAVAQMATRLCRRGVLDAGGRPHQPFCVLVGVEEVIDARSRPLLLSCRVAALRRALRALQAEVHGFVDFAASLELPLCTEGRARLSRKAADLFALLKALKFLHVEQLEVPASPPFCPFP